MAQNITLLGASYSNVPSVILPKTGGGTASFTDVSDTTATASDVASGKKFYAADGTETTGTASGGGGASNIVVGTFTKSSSGALTVNIPYTGSGYIKTLTIRLTDGAPSTSDYYKLVGRYAAALYVGTKQYPALTPNYDGSGDEDMLTYVWYFKNSTSSATTYSATGSIGYQLYNDTASSSSASTIVTIRSQKSFSAYFRSSSRGFATNTSYTYIAEFSS